MFVSTSVQVGRVKDVYMYCTYVHTYVHMYTNPTFCNVVGVCNYQASLINL